MNAKRRSSARRSKANKTKRPKFLRLRLQFPADEGRRIVGTGMRQITGVDAPAADATSDQPSLFPLQPENQVEERESTDHENVAFFFCAADGGASTLSGLLESCPAGESISSHANDSSSRLHCLPPPSPASLTQAYGEERAALERNALRNRDRDSSEEKWVCYSEVVKEEEVTSSAVDPPRPPGIQRMSLKLDYEEIMNAWSNKGPLYIDATDNTSQIVPDISHHFLLQEPSSYIGLNSGFNGGSWIVPDIAGDMESGEMMNVSRNEDHLLKMGHREASVMRYKEKRQNRLFSKKIRYQVRKLNAEKRPRLKGRFVKRS